MRISEESLLDRYFREISQTPLLTAGEEEELAGRIQKGDEEARSRMIRANLRLVVRIARDFGGFGVPIGDLISEGNLGLMRAVELYDPEKGVRFAVYAGYWIRQSVRQALGKQAKTVRLPISQLSKISKMKMVLAVLTEALGREPTDEEMAEELGIPAQKIAQLRRSAQHQVSLDEPVLGNPLHALVDDLADEESLDPCQSLVRQDLKDQLDDMLAVLDEREKSIIYRRFGLEGITPMKLEDMGREMGVSRERIRQLQNVALQKMNRFLMRKDLPLGFLRSGAASRRAC